MTNSTRVEHLQPETMASPLGMYAQVTRDNHSGIVFVAGQVAVNPSGTFVGKDDFRAQAREVFRNIGRALTSAGSGFECVLKLTTYIVREQDLPTFREIRKEIYGEIYPNGGYPAHTLLIAAGLSAPEHLIEVEAIAVTRSGASHD